MFSQSLKKLLFEDFACFHSALIALQRVEAFIENSTLHVGDGIKGYLLLRPIFFELFPPFLKVMFFSQESTDLFERCYLK